MASNNISESLSDEQIISLLQMLFTNMNNLDKLYYDMFINTTPLTLTLERYNEDGVIESYELPNRAKDRMNIVQGRGEPERSQIAGVGTLYLDVLTSNIWVKTIDAGATGWVMLYTPANFIQGREYMSPTGDASGLTGLSASNLEGGIMDVRVGGTGTQGLTGIIKGRGSDLPFVTATPGVDYLKPQTFIGSLGLFLRESGSESDLPEGWLWCNGGQVSQNDYNALYEAIKNIYPNNIINNGSYVDIHGTKILVDATKFVLPDFRDKYIRGWDGSSTVVGSFQKCAVPNIRGTFFNTQESETALPKNPTGAFERTAQAGNGVDGTRGWFETMDFSAARYQPTKNNVVQESVYKDDVYEVRVNNLCVVVAIYAGIAGVEY